MDQMHKQNAQLYCVRDLVVFAGSRPAIQSSCLVFLIGVDMFNQDICKRCVGTLSNYDPVREKVQPWDDVEDSDTRLWERDGLVGCPDEYLRSIDGSDHNCPFTLEHVISKGC